MARRFVTGAMVLVFAALAWTGHVSTQTKPALGDYYQELPATVLDASYAPRSLGSVWTEDLNGDGNQDLVILGADTPKDGVTADNFTAQPGRIFFGDGQG